MIKSVFVFTVKKILLKKIFFLFWIDFFIFLEDYDVLISKIIKKNTILIYFQIKNILKYHSHSDKYYQSYGSFFYFFFFNLPIMNFFSSIENPSSDSINSIW